MWMHIWRLRFCIGTLFETRHFSLWNAVNYRHTGRNGKSGCFERAGSVRKRVSPIQGPGGEGVDIERVALAGKETLMPDGRDHRSVVGAQFQRRDTHGEGG